VVVESAESFQLREPGVYYYIDFGPKNDNIGQEMIIWPDQSAREHRICLTAFCESC